MQQEEWEGDIFDEGGTLLAAEVFLWLLRRLATCCSVPLQCLRRWLVNHGVCVAIFSPLDSTCESDGYDSGRDTDDNTEWEEGEGQHRATRGPSRSLSVWPRRTVHLCRPLLSGSPSTHYDQSQLQRDNVVRSLLFTTANNQGSSSDKKGEVREAASDAAPSPLPSCALLPSTQRLAGAIPGACHRGPREGSGEGDRLREVTPVEGETPSLRRACIGCYSALARTVAYYNVFVSQRTTETQAYDASVPSAASRHAMSGSQAPSPPRAAHTEGSVGASAMPPPPPLTSPDSLGHPFLFDVACVGQGFVLLQYVALVVLTATVVLLSVFSFYHFRLTSVEDVTACNRYPFEDRIRPDWSFSLICFLLNGVLAVRYAVRAVRYEKGGPLVVQVVVVVLQVCRAVYFLLVVTQRYMHAPTVPTLSASQPPSAPLMCGMHGDTLSILGSGADTQGSGGASFHAKYAPSVMPGLQPLRTFTRVSVVTSVLLFVAASVLSPCVYASFGWRRYALGIVQVSLSRVRQRLTVLRTCVQLDGVITANAYLATVFLLDTWPDQRTLLLMTLAIFALHYLFIPMLRRSRHWWPLLCAGGVLVTVSAYYISLIAGALRNDRRLRSMSNSPWYSECYLDQLRRCLDRVSLTNPITIFRDTFGVGCDSLHRSYNPSQREPRQWPTAGVFQNAPIFGTTHGVSSLHTNRDTGVHPRATSPSPYPALAMSLRSVSSVQNVNNATDTYLPTLGAFPDYFRVHGCNATCFLAREESDDRFFERHIAGCCADYGQCRLKDEYRTYAVLLLVMLMIFSSAVRMVLLVVAWRRWVEEDDVTIELFVQEHCRRYNRTNHPRWRSHRRQRHFLCHRYTAAPVGSGGGFPSQSPRGSHALHEALHSPPPPPTPPPPPPPPPFPCSLHST
ncbi:hypothetical protein JKF63_03370 [Porcisia hertigi]|uniref:Uncharacterized protein n=1 Tax=Porcisia hertigi TaxID=2761500 RepID=A0A836HYV7_9TRYP|nr:hypothetical protein JKF63_03370 [Porcisia hertigi]